MLLPFLCEADFRASHSPKCQQYYISLCSKLVNEGGREVKNPKNSVNVVYGCPKVFILQNVETLYYIKL